MKTRLKLHTAPRQRISWRKTVLRVSLIGVIGTGVIFSYLNLGRSNVSTASDKKSKSIAVGSWIVPMDLNSDKPVVIGFLQDIIQNSSVPVKWCPEDNDFPGGLLWIDGDLITPLVASKLETWRSNGVILFRVQKDVRINGHYELNCFPIWIIDPSVKGISSWKEFIASTLLPDYSVSYASPATLQADVFSPTLRWKSISKKNYADPIFGFMEASSVISGDMGIRTDRTDGTRLTLATDKKTDNWKFQWTSNSSGRFSDPTGISTDYIAAADCESDIVRVRATDENGLVRTACIELKKADRIRKDVEVSAFTAHVANKGILIKWSTTSEYSNDFFTVERSVNGASWESVASLPAAGNTQSSRQYHLTDEQPIEGRSYYRLSQTGFSGRTSYFQTISVDNYRSVGQDADRPSGDPLLAETESPSNSR